MLDFFGMVWASDLVSLDVKEKLFVISLTRYLTVTAQW